MAARRRSPPDREDQRTLHSHTRPHLPLALSSLGAHPASSNWNASTAQRRAPAPIRRAKSAPKRAARKMLPRWFPSTPAAHPVLHLFPQPSPSATPALLLVRTARSGWRCGVREAVAPAQPVFAGSSGVGLPPTGSPRDVHPCPTWGMTSDADLPGQTEHLTGSLLRVS